VNNTYSHSSPEFSGNWAVEDDVVAVLAGRVAQLAVGVVDDVFVEEVLPALNLFL